MATTKSKSSAPAKKTGRSFAGKSTQQPTFSEGSMLEEFMVESLKDIYWAEKHLTKALPKMQKAATSPQLKDAFGQHLEITKTQISRLEQAFEMLGKKAQAKKCDAMEGLTKEAEGIIEETEKGTMTRDVALIMAAQKVEHYEIATYGGLKQLATTMGNQELSSLMDETLTEEKEADQMLTSLAENNINTEAAEEEA
jgi:ferritin-like metal-binding protein YciE